MITTLGGRVLERYTIFSIVPVGVAPKTLNQIRVGLIDKFRNPKSEYHCITEIKYIKQLSTKYAWDFDNIFNKLMVKLSIQISNVVN